MNTKKISFAVAAVGLSLIVNLALNAAIPRWFPVRPVVSDLIFTLTPMIGWMQYVADIVVVVSPLLLALVLLRSHRQDIAYVITIFAIAELARGILMVLTPLGLSYGSAIYGLTHYSQYGQWPSGHTVMVATAWLLAPKDSRWLRPTLLALMLIEMTALLLSRGHYSIDIVGGFLVAYIVTHELERFRPDLTLVKA